MIYGKVELNCNGKLFSIELGDEVPPEVEECPQVEILARYSFNTSPGDITLYKLGNVYGVTLYDTTTEVLWAISDNPLEVVKVAQDNLMSGYVNDLVKVVRGLLEGDEDSKLEAERLLREIGEVKQAFDSLRERVKLQLEVS